MIACMADPPQIGVHLSTEVVPVAERTWEAEQRLLSEQLDASRRVALTTLLQLPAWHALDFFVDLLAAARSLGEDEQGHATRCLLVGSRAELARRLGWSYDATSQYVSVLTLLDLVRVRSRRHAPRLALLIPLGPYQPPASLLMDLEALLSSPARRPKLKRLAQQIRGRVRQMLGRHEEPGTEPAVVPSIQSPLTAPPCPTVLPDPCAGLHEELAAMRARLGRIEQMLAALLAPHEAGRQRVCPDERGASAGSCPAGGLGLPDDHAQAHQPAPTRSPQAVPGGQAAHEMAPSLRRLAGHWSGRGAREAGVQGSESVPSPSSAICGQEGRPASARVGSAGRAQPEPAWQTGGTSRESADGAEQAATGARVTPAADSWPQTPGPGAAQMAADAREGRAGAADELAPLADAEPQTAADAEQILPRSPLADSAPPADSWPRLSAAQADALARAARGTEGQAARNETFRSVRFLEFIEKNVTNVERLARFFCWLFGEPPGKEGIYRHLLRQGYRDARLLAATALYALVHFHCDGTLTNPAALFIARCKRFQREGLPQEAADLLCRFGESTQQELLAALSQQSRVPEAPAHTLTPLCPPAKRRAPGALSPAPALRVHVPLPAGGGMSQEQAGTLREQLAWERALGMCQRAVLPLSDGSWVLLLDGTRNPRWPRQLVLTSLAHWQQIRPILLEEGVPRVDDPETMQAMHERSELACLIP